jgi:hypothetical protein
MDLPLFALLVFLGGSLFLLSFLATPERAALEPGAAPVPVNSEAMFSSERSPYMRDER